MKPDKLEKYILDHREAFDDQEPDPAMWDRIEKRRAPVLRLHWQGIAWRAAAVAVIFIASYFFHDYMSGRKAARNDLFTWSQDGEPSPMLRELIEADAYYTSLIDLRRNEVYRLTEAYPEIRNEIDYELIAMDKVFSELKEDLKDNTSNEEVIEAMIQNYRLKLEILEDMLHRIKQANEQQKQQQDEDNIMVY
ncbi:MAG: hypothetical protein R6W71_04775 [Bacteroidales bacterium]